MHGLYVTGITRGLLSDFCSTPVSDTPDRENAFVEGFIQTENVSTRVQFKMLPTEVRALNVLEERIAKRLINEMEVKGK